MPDALDRLLPRLRCPLGRTALHLASATELAALNARIQQGEVYVANADAWDRPLEAALLSADSRFAYPIVEGILVLLKEEALSLQGRQVPELPAMSINKNMVKEFYNKIGWKKTNETDFADATIFEDLRPVAAEYLTHCRLRTNEALRGISGDFILDVASGPVQYDEYLTYHQPFRYRICMDISFEALAQARRRVGDRGVYILGDITNLPFADEALDAAISLHTVYHVPREEQKQAVDELIRVTKAGSRALVIYNWGWHSWFTNVMLAPVWAWRLAKRVFKLVARSMSKDRAPDTYFYAYSPGWFRSQEWKAKSLEITVWRGLTTQFTQFYIHEGLGGRKLVRWFQNWEDKHPKSAGKWGYFPMLIFQK